MGPMNVLWRFTSEIPASPRSLKPFTMFPATPTKHGAGCPKLGSPKIQWFEMSFRIEMAMKCPGSLNMLPLSASFDPHVVPFLFVKFQCSFMLLPQGSQCSHDIARRSPRQRPASPSISEKEQLPLAKLDNLSTYGIHLINMYICICIYTYICIF